MLRLWCGVKRMLNTNTVLVVDDDPLNRAFMKKFLADSYQILEASNGKMALETLEKEGQSIVAILLDLVMPIMDGYEFLRCFSKNQQYQNIPVLVVTSDENQNGEKTCLELGAWDFIRKPFNDITLKLRLANIIGRSQMHLLEKLKYLTEHDALTGLYNRTMFFAETRHLLDAHPDVRFMFIRFDIERFHLINSFYGEEEGNELLKFVADAFRKYAKTVSYCTYGKIESDVFCVCVPQNEVDLPQFAEKARNVLSTYNYNCYIEPTYGVYVINDTNVSIESMYEFASLASKKCKNKYMNYIEYYDQSMSETLIKEQSYINEMHSALDSEQFEVYLQPKYLMNTNTPYGAEALVRWRHPEKGLIYPGEFIPVFERNGFIGKLDYYMWESVCKLLRKWIDNGLNPAPISVNVSRVNMYNPHVVALLTDLLKKYKIPSDLLNLEITESSYMDNPNQMKKTITELKSNGFVILMDDFGSGYSSLNALKDIDVDILKIDMKFLPTGEADSRGERILSSIIRMAGWLDLPVIVEGVETHEQKDFLQSIGCNYVQGYLFAKPMPVSDYEIVLQTKQADHHVINNFNDINKLDSIWSASPNAEQIFKNIMQPIAVYEYAHGNCEPIRFNKAFIDLFGFEAAIENSNGKPGKHISVQDKDSLKTAFEKAVKEQSAIECEYQWNAENGAAIWIHVKLQYVKSVSEVHALFAIFTDITEQKRLEYELKGFKGLFKKDAEKKTVLVADDSNVSRTMIKSILQDHYTVLEAENGKKALTLLSDNKDEIVLILLDIVMPEMDGRTFLNHKNADPAMVNIPVVIISAESNNDMQIEAHKLGASDYVTKPFVSEILLRRLRNVIEGNARLIEK